MNVSHMKLWHLLLDRSIKKKDLAEMAKVSDFTLRKLNHDENVTVETLGRICLALGCSIDDICEITPDAKERNGYDGED